MSIHDKMLALVRDEIKSYEKDPTTNVCNGAKVILTKLRWLENRFLKIVQEGEKNEGDCS